MRAGPLVAGIVLTVLVVQPVDAAHCTTWSTSKTDLDETTIILGVENAVYLPVTICRSTCTYGAVGPLYFEANGIPGLQRADPRRDDTCHAMIEADSLLF